MLISITHSLLLIDSFVRSFIHSFIHSFIPGSTSRIPSDHSPHVNLIETTRMGLSTHIISSLQDGTHRCWCSLISPLAVLQHSLRLIWLKQATSTTAMNHLSLARSLGARLSEMDDDHFSTKKILFLLGWKRKSLCHQLCEDLRVKFRVEVLG